MRYIFSSTITLLLRSAGFIFPAPNRLAFLIFPALCFTHASLPTAAQPTGGPTHAVTGNERSCSNGSAAGFPCRGVDLKSFLPVDRIGGEGGAKLNDVWGWTDPKTGAEYALVGRTNGTAFVDVSDPTNPVYIGEMPLTDGARASSWRDVKVYKNHAFVVADEAKDHGVQIFDLTRLRDVNPEEYPATFHQDAHYDRVNSVRNIVVNKKNWLRLHRGQQ
jgi:choice-of-anchor B domain-containing protein